MKRALQFGFLFAAMLIARAPAWAAWGTGTATCAAQSETASQTLACTLATANLEAGNVAVVNCSGDNTATSDGASTTHLAVTDSGSNTYTFGYEFTEGTGGAAGGATVSVWFSKLTTQLTSGSSTITCDYGASITDRAMHLVGEFTVTAGATVSVSGTSQGEASGGADAGALTISSLTSGEYLFVRGVATESNAALSMTATASYSLPANPGDGCNNTTGGGEASDMGACSEYRILTGTGDTSNPALVDTSNDNASVYVALKEAASQQFDRGATETLSPSDSPATLRAAFSGPSETLSASDSPATQRAMNAAPSETLSASDSPAISAGRSGSPTETLSASDSASGQWGVERGATETLSPSDSPAISAGRSGSPTETLSASDSPATQRAMNAAPSETLSASDSPAISAGRRGSPTETLSPSDSPGISAGRSGSPTETLSASDNAAGVYDGGGGQSFNVLVAMNLSPSDGAGTVLARSRFVVETFPASDLADGWTPKAGVSGEVPARESSGEVPER